MSKHAYFLICTKYTKLVPFGITSVKPPKYQNNFASVHHSFIFGRGQIAVWRKSELFTEHNKNALPGTSSSNLLDADLSILTGCTTIGLGRDVRTDLYNNLLILFR